MIGRERVDFARVGGRGADACVVRTASHTLDVPLFAGEPDAAACAALVQALKDVAPDAQGYLPLHVSLPGPVVQIGVIALDALPKKHAERVALVQWHFSQSSAPGARLVCDCEAIGTSGEKPLLLGFAIDAAWHACVVDALAAAGLTGWSLNADVCRQFNRFHDQLCSGGEGGALVTLSRDAWSLLLWDDAGRVRHCSSRWRSTGSEEPVRIAVDVERRILAAVQSLPDLHVGGLHLAADDADAAVGDAIDARLRTPCIRLAGAASAASTEPGLLAPFAAALEA